MVRCRYCKAEIPSGAVLCSECKCYQDWRGNLPITSTGLALVVALLSVTATMVPVLGPIFSPPRSRASVSMPIVRGERLVLVATNIGDRPATISTADLTFKAMPFSSVSLEPASASDTFVPPGAKQITYDIKLVASIREMLDAASRLSEISDDSGANISMTQSDGTTKQIWLHVSREMLREALRTHYDNCLKLLEAKLRDRHCMSLQLPQLPGAQQTEMESDLKAEKAAK